MSEHSHDYEFPCAGPISAHIRVGGGALLVTGEETTAASVRVSPYDNSDESREAAEQTRVEFSSGALHVQTPENPSWGFRRGYGRVRIEARIPVDSRLRVVVGSADVRTEGRIGDIEVQSGSGDTTVAQISGDLKVESGSGEVRTGDIAGALRVKTGSGDVSAGAVAGPVSVTVASGDVRLAEVGGSVRASSASGDIGIGVARAGEVTITSASGDVEVGVAVGTGVWLDLNTVSGSTSSDLSMTGAAPAGGAALTLRVKTVSGDISVHRVGAAAA